jgi:hypothetical protein
MAVTQLRCEPRSGILDYRLSRALSDHEAALDIEAFVQSAMDVLVM